MNTTSSDTNEGIIDENSNSNSQDAKHRDNGYLIPYSNLVPIPRFLDSFINNLLKYDRFYCIKLFLNLLSSVPNGKPYFYPSFKKDYKAYLSSPVSIMLMETIICEMTYRSDNTPKPYKSFLTKHMMYSREPNTLIDYDKHFCDQGHPPGCKRTFETCSYSIIRMFVGTWISLSKVYTKLYAIPLIASLFTKSRSIDSVKRNTMIYITSVVRSTTSLTTMYSVFQTYLMFVDQIRKPERINYLLGSVLASSMLILGEQKDRYRSIVQFMTAVYINMILYDATPEMKRFWRFLLPVLMILSFKRTGPVKTLTALF